MVNVQLRQAVRLLIALSAAGIAPTAAAVEAVEVLEAPQQAGGPSGGAAVGTVEEIVVTGRSRSAATDVTVERIEQPVVVDIISAEQISRVGDSSVSLALRRLPGVTLVDGQYIYIRGLGERYSSTTLNGATVPSPDLTRNVIPLDIFPSEIVQSISIQKGYSVDRPAAFGGGNVDIRTRSLPEEFFAQFQIGSGWNSDLTDDVLTYRGGGDDGLGTDDGTRALPQAISNAIGAFRGNFNLNNIRETLAFDGNQYTLADAQVVNRQLATSLYRDLDVYSKAPDPDMSAQASIGNRWDVTEDGMWRFGVLALADYGSQWRNRTRINRSASQPDVENGETRRSSHQVALTGSVTAGLEWGDDHAVNVLGMYLRNTEDEAALTQRTNLNFRISDGQQLRDYRVRYEERDLTLVQLTGRHALGETTRELLGGWVPSLLNDLSFDWFYSDATARTELPSEVTVSAVDAVDPANGRVLQSAIRSTSSAADFRFTDLEDEVHSWGGTVTLPFTRGRLTGSLSGGWAYSEKGRGYEQIQLGLGTTAQAALPILIGSPAEVLTDANITNPDYGFLLSLGGLGTESYLAGEVVNAAFGGFDVTWDDTWRFTGGARWEDWEQLSVPVDILEFDPGVGKITLTPQQLANAAKAVDDYYPAFAVTYMRQDFWAEEFQLRLGYSATTARPDLREVADSTYIDPFTDARVRGNPNLVPADLANYDLRAEWFFSNRDSLTFSLFYKDIERPIETIEGAGTDNNLSFTFVNADKAELYGAEVEWVKSLDMAGDWFGDWASGFFTTGNVTWSESEIEIGDAALNVTNPVRPLTQQSEYIANLQLGYDSPGGKHSATLAYNTFGERLYFAGRAGAQDAYEQPFDSVDFVYSWYPTEALTVKLRLQNLLGEAIEIKQGNVVILEQDLGTTFKFDLTMRF